MKTQRASKSKIDKKIKIVKRFNSKEYFQEIVNFKVREYLVYPANGQASVYKALNAVKSLYPNREYLTVAINKTQRIIARV